MPQSLCKVTIHIVFSTKNRQNWIDRNIEKDLFSVMGAKINEMKCNCIKVGGYRNHVHLLLNLGKETTISNLVKEVKIASSHWIKTKGNAYSNFYWQRGYGAFSVSENRVPATIKYIAEQDIHHGRLKFQDECRKIFEKNGLELDERYFWD